jgi:HEPN domain-containing protein
MEEWELFLERGRKDIKLAESLFQENHDYKMSAYVAQQALEKYVKAYLLKSKIVKKPIKITKRIIVI